MAPKASYRDKYQWGCPIVFKSMNPYFLILRGLSSFNSE